MLYFYTVSGSNVMDKPFMQYRSPVGLGPSLKT